MSNYSKINLPSDARVELHDALGLTGAEVSVNSLPAGAQVPFVHSHKQNEEIYAILSGSGVMTLMVRMCNLKPAIGYAWRRK